MLRNVRVDARYGAESSMSTKEHGAISFRLSCVLATAYEPLPLFQRIAHLMQIKYVHHADYPVLIEFFGSQEDCPLTI